MSEQKGNFFEESLKPLKKAATILKLEPEVADVLSSHERFLTVTIPVNLDNGRIKVFTGYRAQLSTTRGPARAGVYGRREN